VAYLLELLVLWTDQTRVITFGIAGVLGMMVGAAAMALAHEDVSVGGLRLGRGRRQPRRRRHLHGLRRRHRARVYDRPGPDGVSTLAVGSILTLAAIIAGCVAAVKYQMWRVERM
jgi:hypothetical protein